MVKNWRQTKQWRLERVRHVMERRQKNQERRVIRTFASNEILKEPYSMCDSYYTQSAQQQSLF